MDEERQLVESAAKGDAEAFGQLVAMHQDRLFTSIVHVIDNAHEAEDVVQEAFVQAYLKLESFRGGSSFYTWLYRIAFNMAVSSQRGRRHHVSVESNRETSGADPSDPDAAPDRTLLEQERVNEVHAALASLSEDHRAVMVLRELEGCNYDQIADILAITKGTVRSRLSRARSLMREFLERQRSK